MTPIQVDDAINEAVENVAYVSNLSSDSSLVLADAESLGGLPAENYATKNYVVDTINQAQLGGDNSEVDLSVYATKDDLTLVRNAIPTTPEDIGALSTSGGNLTGNLKFGNKLEFWEDAEGGNIRIVPKDGAVTDYWDIDANNDSGEGLRIFAYKNANNANGAGYVFPLNLYTDGSIGVSNTSKTRERLGITPANIGAVPTSRTINNKALSSNISLSASDVGAVPTSRTINSKALSSNISLSASDVGAAPIGLVSGTYSASSDTAINTAINTAYSAMNNLTVAHIAVNVTAGGTSLYSGQNIITLYKTNANYGIAEARNYTSFHTYKYVRVLSGGTWGGWVNDSPAYFGNALYSVRGEILGSAGDVRGVGQASIHLNPEGIVRVDYSVKVTTGGTLNNKFSVGIEVNKLRALNSNIPNFTPKAGGVCTYYKSDGVISTALQGYGGSHSVSGDRWSCGRVYTLDGGFGTWPDNQYGAGYMIVGTCYGSVW